MSIKKFEIPIENKRIAMIRKDKNLTQKEFAAFLQMSQSYLSEVENGKGKPSIEMLREINKQFPDINLDWLLTGRGMMYRDEQPEIAQIPRWLTNWWRQANDEHRMWLKVQLAN